MFSATGRKFGVAPRYVIILLAFVVVLSSGTALGEVCGPNGICTPLPTLGDRPRHPSKQAIPLAVPVPRLTSGTMGEPSALVAGDTCATATVVGAIPYSDSGDTCTANDDYDETCGFVTPAPGSPDVVYAYTPAADGCIRASLCSVNTNYDTKIEVYESAGGDPNDCGPYQSGSYRMCSDDTVACSVDQLHSIIDKMFVRAGHTYYIVVDGFGGACGQYELSIDDCGCTPFPPNDSCASATGAVLSDGVTVTFTGDNTCATNECSLLSPAGISGHTWESFTVPGPEHMDITLDYCGTTPTHETVWAFVFDNCPCEGANFLTQNAFDRDTCGDNNVTFFFYGVPPGTYYYPVMRTTAGEPSSSEGPYQINVTGTVVATPTCGDNMVNQTSEDCDGTDDAFCPGECRADCTCPPAPTCGDNVVNQTGEECDGTDDAACPGRCRSDCTCAPIGDIPAASAWGLITLSLLLLAGARIYFGRRSAATGAAQ